MASEALLKRIQENKEWLDAHGISQELIDANVQLAQYAIHEEKDVQCALDLSALTKRMIDKVIEVRTEGHTFWELEHLLQVQEQPNKIIDDGYALYRLEAPYRFESYLFYMEKNRKYEKRFYVPRRGTLHTIVNDLQRLEDDELEVYGLSLPARTGKALADNTPVLTRNGWKNHGELIVGDEVIGLDGNFKKVIAVHPKCYMEYRVTFADGEEILCHGNHEWIVEERSGRKELSSTVIETKDMAGRVNLGDNHRRYAAHKRGVVNGENKELAVAPYTLGAWLGDGRNNNPDIANPEMDRAIIEKIITDGYPISWHSVHKTTGVHYYGFKTLRARLQKYGMCHSRKRTQKHIPQEYFTASKEQRLWLLAGLLDTDGTLKKGENRYAFSTTEEQLRDDFVALVNTFGWRTSVHKEEPKISSSGIQGRKTVWIIGFNPTIYIPCQVERKKLRVFSKQRHITITSIEKIDRAIQGNCITVEGGIYCVGRTLKPTHNSTMGVFFLTWVGYRKPNSNSAAGGHSGMLAKRIFKGYKDLVDTPEYTYTELFSELHPEYKKPIERISSDPAEFIINLGDPDVFSTISCRGADASWTGVINVSNDGYLYIDDLVRDREHSMSATRMENTYQDYQNKMVDRMANSAKKILIATRWNVEDVIGREERLNEGNPRALFRAIPALDENDKSNFRYEYHGFSSTYYINMRERLDKAEWMAKYQQKPFVREGLLFPMEQLRFFNGAVPDEQKKVVAALDPAFGKGDYLSMPICFDYGDTEKYIVDWIYDNRTQGYTVPLIVDKIDEHFIMELKVEKNNGGDLMADNIQAEMDKRGIRHCKILRVSAPVKMSKEDKIGAYADFVKRYFQFLMPKKWTEIEDEVEFIYRPSDQYRKAVDALVVYSPGGKNKNDDAPDAITQLAMMFEGERRRRTARVISSPI